jgi:hypothetical protein
MEESELSLCLVGSDPELCMVSEERRSSDLGFTRAWTRRAGSLTTFTSLVLYQLLNLNISFPSCQKCINCKKLRACQLPWPMPMASGQRESMETDNPRAQTLHCCSHLPASRRQKASKKGAIRKRSDLLHIPTTFREPGRRSLSSAFLCYSAFALYSYPGL